MEGGISIMGVLRRILIGERQRCNLRIGLRGLSFKKGFPPTGRSASSWSTGI